MHISLTLIVHVVGLLPALTAASCSRFVRDGPVYYEYAVRQNQTISSGVVCTKESNSTMVRYGSCNLPSANLSSTIPGCEVQGTGLINAVGYTNLSISAADTQGLFPLVTSTLNSTEYDSGGLGFNYSLSGCVSPLFNNFGTACIHLGTAGYMTATPLLKCLNGTLEGCSGGPVNNGTAVAVCGVPYQAWNTDASERIYYPLVQEVFWNTSVAQARNMTVNPAQYSNCTADYQATSASSRCLVGSITLVSTIVVAWALLMSS